MRTTPTGEFRCNFIVVACLVLSSFFVACGSGDCVTSADCESGYRCVFFEATPLAEYWYCVNDFADISNTDKTVNFKIGLNEVTVADYQICYDNLKCKSKPDISKAEDGCTWENRADDVDMPVNCVTWAQANEYCKSIYDNGRLCTSEEWGIAAGDGIRTYPWGAGAPTCDLANFVSCGFSGPTGVWDMEDGMTPDGVRNMAGNVAEWVQNDAGGGKRVIRGGSYESAAKDIKTTASGSALSTSQLLNIGFRCCMDGE